MSLVTTFGAGALIFAWPLCWSTTQSHTLDPAEGPVSRYRGDNKRLSSAPGGRTFEPCQQDRPDSHGGITTRVLSASVDANELLRASSRRFMEKLDAVEWQVPDTLTK